ncbi:hypothetical protein [Desulfonatronospira sp.]|uniref:hypothetical protein n=1 Tax=Desulfonatronospira sp. TaxID=1962951 RepID=UPI0025BB0C92|nr:hypothetical protein [Desulfonatronospira sp.]
MDLTLWMPSVATTSILALGLFLGRKMIASFLTKGVEHKFNSKLEKLKSDLRQKEELHKLELQSKQAEITALRDYAVNSMATRNQAMHKRQVEAVELIWSTVQDLAPAKRISSLMAVIKFEPALEEAAKNENFRHLFSILDEKLDPSKTGQSMAAKARPFVTPMVWAFFSAYEAIAMLAVIKLKFFKSGIGSEKWLNTDAMSQLIKTALPHQSDFIDKYGHEGFHFLLDELENKLLTELQKMMSGVVPDQNNLEQAAKLINSSRETMNMAKQSYDEANR